MHYRKPPDASLYQAKEKKLKNLFKLRKSNEKTFVTKMSHYQEIIVQVFKFGKIRKKFGENW